MSRVGKSKLALPDSISLNIKGNVVEVLNKKSSGLKANFVVPEGYKVIEADNKIGVDPSDPDNVDVSQWGTIVRNLFQTIQGIDKPFEKKVNLVGVGYKGALQGKMLVLDLGFSHKIEYILPEGVEVKIVKPTELLFSSMSKQKLGQAVSEVMKFRPPEPYKGKGVIPEGTFVMRKEGKKK